MQANSATLVVKLFQLAIRAGSAVDQNFLYNTHNFIAAKKSTWYADIIAKINLEPRNEPITQPITTPRAQSNSIASTPLSNTTSAAAQYAAIATKPAPTPTNKPTTTSNTPTPATTAPATSVQPTPAAAQAFNNLLDPNPLSNNIAAKSPRNPAPTAASVKPVTTTTTSSSNTTTVTPSTAPAPKSSGKIVANPLM